MRTMTAIVKALTVIVTIEIMDTARIFRYYCGNLCYSGNSGISDIPASWIHHFLGMGVLLEVRNGNIYGIS